MADQHNPGVGLEGQAKEAEAHHKPGLAGWMTKTFLHSPLTPLLLMAMFAIGLMGMLLTPREEDPQISVPMVDIMVGYPGASAERVNNLVAEPLERLMSEIPGVEHVYSISHDGQALVIVQFYVGQQMEPSLVKLHAKLESHRDVIPDGVTPPLVKPKSVDDVPVVTLTLSSDNQSIVTLRKLALDMLQHIKSIPTTGQSFMVGGSPEQIRVEVDPARLNAHGLTLSQIAGAIQAANQRTPAGDMVSDAGSFTVYSGDFLRDADQVGGLVVSVQNARPIFLRDVARIFQGEREPDDIVTQSVRLDSGAFGHYPAVTIAVGKKRGTNGVDVAQSVLSKVDEMQGRLIPADVRVDVTRDNGKTADEKVSGLIFKLFIVTGIVTVLMLVMMGVRPAIIVLVTIPVVVLMTLFTALLLGFTINRVSMFALVFAIGILVDDAIVVAENIYRRWLQARRIDDEITIDAVSEVGNPTVLATFTVVAALLPMGFVSGMMGPYMVGIPVLSSAAMIFSLFAAFIFVPWMAMKMKPSMAGLERQAEKEQKFEHRVERVYGKIIGPLMNNRFIGLSFLVLVFLALLAAVSMFYFQSVAFKMLPFDNKSELNVVLDMPEGTDLFVTANVARRMAEELQAVPEITSYQTYVGTASPFNFNGLVRHYYLRSEPWQADIAVILKDKGDRERSSHDIAVAVRDRLTPIARAANARLTVAETPPGPPVLAPLVGEVYGPTAEVRRQFARDLTRMFEETPNMVDVNNFLEEPHQELVFEVDRLRAGMFGVNVADINREVGMAMGGHTVGTIKTGGELEQTAIVLQLPLALRANVGNLQTLPIRTSNGQFVPLSELGKFSYRTVSQPIYHKDLKPVEYVTGEIVGKLGAPLYGILGVYKHLKDYTAPDGVKPEMYLFTNPKDTSSSLVKWDGEWHVTYVTFRDMGAAFMGALVLIYMLVVAEFRNFILPLIVMSPIPLTLIGIVPGHWLLGADFTATSMIGFIALAGIIVRNSILLVAFTESEVRQGRPVREAVVRAAEARFRPILITSLALIVGSTVLLTDPIFQGMAVALLFGSISSTILTLLVVPLGSVSAAKQFYPKPTGGETAPGGAPGGTPGGGAGGRPRLQKKGEGGVPALNPTPALAGATAGAAAATTIPRLVKRTPTDPAPATAAPAAGRPPRLVKRTEGEADAAAAPVGQTAPQDLPAAGANGAAPVAAAAPATEWVPANGTPPEAVLPSEAAPAGAPSAGPGPQDRSPRDPMAGATPAGAAPASSPPQAGATADDPAHQNPGNEGAGSTTRDAAASGPAADASRVAGTNTGGHVSEPAKGGRQADENPPQPLSPDWERDTSVSVPPATETLAPAPVPEPPVPEPTAPPEAVPAGGGAVAPGAGPMARKRSATPRKPKAAAGAVAPAPPRKPTNGNHGDNGKNGEAAASAASTDETPGAPPKPKVARAKRPSRGIRIKEEGT